MNTVNRRREFARRVALVTGAASDRACGGAGIRPSRREPARRKNIDRQLEPIARAGTLRAYLDACGIIYLTEGPSAWRDAVWRRLRQMRDSTQLVTSRLSRRRTV
ncbi:MAG: hypothetical protein M3O50_05425 [Myxococcota bacterium]|nr:hypothetical protein [Myxococcota bacterium]